MVQVVENRARLKGEVLDVRDDPDRPGHVILRTAVSAVTPHAGYRNLIGDLPGSTVDIVARLDPAQARPKPGPTEMSVRLAGPGTYMAAPAPEGP